MKRTSVRAAAYARYLRKRACLQEAGHAVTALALGFCVDGMHVEDVRTTSSCQLGQTRVETPSDLHYWTRRSMRACLFRYLTVLVAGKAAETLASEGEDRDDHEASFLWDDALEEEYGTDHDAARETLNQLVPPVKRRGKPCSEREPKRLGEGYLCGARGAALDLVKKNEDAVRYLAARLEQQGDLTSSEVRDLVGIIALLD